MGWWIALLLIPFGVATVLSDPALPSKWLLLSIYLLLAGGVLIVPRLRARMLPDFQLRISIVTWLYIGTVALAGLSLLWTRNPGDGLIHWSRMVMGLLLFHLLAGMLGNGKQQIEVLVRLSLVFAGILLVWGSIHFIYLLATEGLKHEITYQVTGPFAHRNLFAHILLLNLPFAIYAVLKMEGWWLRAGVAILLGVIVLIVLMMVRTVWLALFVMGVAFIVITYVRRARLRRAQGRSAPGRLKWLGLIAVVAIGLGVGLYAKIGSPDRLFIHTTGITNLTYGSPRERVDLWKKTLEMTAERPVTGWGLGSWKVMLPKYGLEDLRDDMAEGRGNFVRAHNDFLQLMSEAGPLTLLTWLVLLFVAFWRSVRDYLRAEEDAIRHLLPVLGLTAFAVLSTVSFPMERATHVIFLNLFLALAVTGKPRTRDKSVAPSNVLLLLSIQLAGAFVVIGIGQIQANLTFTEVSQARASQNWARVDHLLRDLPPFHAPMGPAATPYYWYRGSARFQLGNTDAALADFEKAREVHPYHLHVLNNLGTCLVQKGRPREAIPHYRQAHAVSGVFEEVNLNLAAVYYNTENLDSAWHFISKVDTATKAPAYPVFLEAIVTAKADKLYAQLEDDVVKRAFRNIKRHVPWLIKMHHKARRDRRTFEKQAVLDVVFFLLNTKKSITLSQSTALGKKYDLPEMQ